MKRILLCLIFLPLAIAAWCQPANSTCDGVIDLGTFPYCQGTVFTNIGATPYDIEFDNNPNCFKDGAPSNDVWFGFKTADERKEIIITIQGAGGNPITNTQAALYRGTCAVNSIVLRQCAVSAVGESQLSFEAFDLTPSAQYYIRVDNFGGDLNEGDFTLCIDEISDDLMISDGRTQLCSGRLFDSGGPTGNYGDNENYTFTICPSEFHRCVSFDLAYFNIEHEAEGIGEKLSFYNGSSINSPLIASIGADEGFGTAHGGGGSCYNVQADDCLTIEFISDGSFNLEGFEGRWECSVDACEPDKQIKISGNITVQQIEDAITTPLSRVKIDTIICDEDAYGTFNGGDETDLGLNRGLLLTTGSPFSAIGPNNDENVTTVNGTPGDNDLDILSQLNGDGSTSNDACVIEMEVEVFSNELIFEYIFASDEYPEFVGETFNDIFALLISGPGIDGIPEIGNQKNLATLPSGEFVQINSVNHLSNWEYYRNNAYGQSIEYDGLTSGLIGSKKSLTASTEVIPCNTYKLKLAIADRGDFAFDSGVFIAEISSGVPAIEYNIVQDIDYLVERCSGDQDKITVTLNRPLTNEVRFKTAISGTATRNLDYSSNLPEEIIFNPGETSKSYSIIPRSDELAEGIETIIVKLINETECGTVDLSEVTIELRDEVSIEIGINQDTIQTCQGGQLIISATGAKEYSWSSGNLISNPFVASPTVTVQQDGWLYVRGTLGNDTFDDCKAIDSIYIEVVDATIEITDFEKVNYCQGESIELTFNSNINNPTISWSSDSGTITEVDGSYTLKFDQPGENQIIRLTQITGGCINTDEVIVNVDEFFFPEFNFIDTTICQSTSLVVVPSVIPSSTAYQWDTSPYISDLTIANPIIKPEADASYSLTATSENGYCTLDTTISVNIIPNEIEIQAPDSLSLCAAESIDISAIIIESGDEPSVRWSFDRGDTGYIGLLIEDFREVRSGYLTARLSSGACVGADSIYVGVDDLPDLRIRPIPNRTSFCVGEVFTLLSDDFTNSFYPDIAFEWLDVPSTNANNLNLALKATESRYYSRKTTNGNCEEIDSIYIEVIDFDASVNFMDTIVCKGENLNIIIDSAIPPDEIIWDPANFCLEAICEQISFMPSVDQTIDVILKSGRCRDSVSLDIVVSDLVIELSTAIIGGVVPIGTEVEIVATPSVDYDGRYFWYVNGELLNEESSVLVFTINSLSEIEVFSEQAINCPGPNSTLIIDVEVPEIEFPNAFIPSSNDRLNQTFTYVAILGDEGFERFDMEVDYFEIFNRWGERVFDCHDQSCLDSGWDGRRGSKESPAEVYAYRFRALLSDGTEVIKKGNVTLIR